jgi:hypothetical protein
MKPPANHVAAALHKVLQHVKQSEDKSLFAVLLSIEQKICKRVLRDVPLGIKKLEAVKLVHERRPAISKLSRYVE